MKFEFSDVTLLKVGAFPYDIGGNKGVSYKANMLINGDFFKLKISADLYNELQEVEPSTIGKATFEVTSSKEVVSVKLVDFATE